jgi:hypothetical protein
MTEPLWFNAELVMNGQHFSPFPLPLPLSNGTDIRLGIIFGVSSSAKTMRVR